MLFGLFQIRQLRTLHDYHVSRPECLRQCQVLARRFSCCECLSLPERTFGTARRLKVERSRACFPRGASSQFQFSSNSIPDRFPAPCHTQHAIR